MTEKQHWQEGRKEGSKEGNMTFMERFEWKAARSMLILDPELLLSYVRTGYIVSSV